MEYLPRCRISQQSKTLWQSSTLPVHLLDVIVLAHGQFMAPFESASFEHIAPFGAGHSFAEAVHAQAATYLRLISSFRHKNLFVVPLLESGDYTLCPNIGQTALISTANSATAWKLVGFFRLCYNHGKFSGGLDGRY